MIRFRDRQHAGEELARRLTPWIGRPGVVLALPRGGVPLAAVVAQRLGMPLDLIIPRKIGHPRNPEYAVAAVVENGTIALNKAEIATLDRDWFEQAVEREQQEAARRRRCYLGDRSPLSFEGKVAILVDDGIATGLTMEVAILDAKARGAQEVVIAVPVVPADTARRLAKMVAAVVAVEIAEQYLGAVGAYYDDFSQVSDQSVIELINQSSSVAQP